MSELRPEGLGAEGGRDEDVSDLMQLYRWVRYSTAVAQYSVGAVRYKHGAVQSR